MLADEFERWADDCGAGLICAKEFTAEEVSSLAGLERRGYFHAPSLPFCTLPIRWRSFEEYLDAMRSGYRRQVLQSLTIREQVGLTIRVVDDIEPHCDRIFPLYEQVMDRAAIQLERLNPAFFRLIATECRSNARAVLVERDDRLLAAAVVLETSGAHTFLLAGLDYAHHRATHSYINLVLELIARAIRARVSRIDLGQTSYDLKRRLGAEVVPLELWLKYRSVWGHSLLRRASGVLFPARTVPARRVFR